MKRSLALILVLLIAGAVQADTTWVQGPVFGDWTHAHSPYFVTGNLSIPGGRTLNIEPGVLVKFFGHYSLLVSGELIAAGTEENPVRFTTDTTLFPDRWRGIRFLQGSGSLAFCTIEHCEISQIGEQVASGIHCSSEADVELIACTIQHCRARPAVGCFNGSTLRMKYCTVRYNNAEYNCCGGGVGIRGDSHVEIIDCLIQNNLGLDGGGVFVNDGSSLAMVGTTLADNSAHTWGGGLYASGRGGTLLRDCFLLDNEAGGSGGGLQARGGTLTVVRSGFIGNESYEGAHVYCDSGQVEFNSCMFAPYNGPFGIGAALHVQEDTEVHHCDIHVWFVDEPLSGDIPPGLGEVARVNANGDSCDAFLNLYQDPQLVSPATDDFNLRPGSPCIDAGDPELPYDPDSTITDIGVLFFDQAQSADPQWVGMPTAVRLQPAYPNPFNPSTTLELELARDAVISLCVFDVRGRLVADVGHGFRSAGHHSFLWDASEMPSGIYFSELIALGTRQTQKLVLLK